MLQGLLRLLGGLKLHVGVAFGQVGEDTVQGHVNHLDLSIDREDLLDVFLQKKKKVQIVLKLATVSTYFTWLGAKFSLNCM